MNFVLVEGDVQPPGRDCERGSVAPARSGQDPAEVRLASKEGAYPSKGVTTLEELGGLDWLAFRLAIETLIHRMDGEFQEK